ncbi:MAG: lipoyl(octanoyl) transferase LipB [Bacteroidetes bacterium]|nr:lipoyl(octanoyl) transferase LipB [Bacteroidota bacterium]
MSISIKNIGLTDYVDALQLQKETHQAVIDGDSDAMISCEHPHVFTFGKSADKNNLLIDSNFLKSINATTHQIDRGGDITYHGPGQLVCYPIINLRKRGFGVKKYVEILEESIIITLREFNIHAYQIQNLTGIWVGVKPLTPRKIGAIGIRIKQGVSMHGFALNISTNLDYFKYINPCGITDKNVTSMLEEGIECTPNEFFQRFTKTFFDLIS